MAPGDVEDYDGICDDEAAAGEVDEDNENISTSHLTVVDKRGNVVAYTLTIEQTGGSGIVVPRRGFLLNNELTDFSAVYDADDPNRIEGGKRPRSSMSPTIVLKDRKPVLALGSPGGSTIITTVLQILVNRLAFGMSLPEALGSPAGLAAQHRHGHRGAGVHRRLRRRARAAGPRSGARRRRAHQRSLHRRGRGYRDRAATAADRVRRAGPPRRWGGPRRPAAVSRSR